MHSIETVPAGVERLDVALDGGFPIGSLSAVVGGGETMSDRLVSEAIATNETVVLTCSRPTELVEQDLRRFHEGAVRADVVGVTPGESFRQSLAALSEECEYLVVYGAERLLDASSPVGLMQALATQTTRHSIATVLSFSMPIEAIGRSGHSALDICDVVVQMAVEIDSSRVETFATVSKHRFGEPSPPLKLLFTPQPTVDETTRIG
jgi:hypothetical protein